MPFGLSNASATFQRLMEQVLACLHCSTCLVYLDDIIVFSRTVAEHLGQRRGMFTRLKNAGLRLKPCIQMSCASEQNSLSEACSVKKGD